jgi:hypothetical protein
MNIATIKNQNTSYLSYLHLLLEVKQNHALYLGKTATRLLLPSFSSIFNYNICMYTGGNSLAIIYPLKLVHGFCMQYYVTILEKPQLKKPLQKHLRLKCRNYML